MDEETVECAVVSDKALFEKFNMDDNKATIALFNYFTEEAIIFEGDVTVEALKSFKIKTRFHW